MYCITVILHLILVLCFDAAGQLGRQEGHPACKNCIVRYWRGYLSERGANDLHIMAGACAAATTRH